MTSEREKQHENAAAASLARLSKREKAARHRARSVLAARTRGGKRKATRQAGWRLAAEEGVAARRYAAATQPACPSCRINIATRPTLPHPLPCARIGHAAWRRAGSSSGVSGHNHGGAGAAGKHAKALHDILLAAILSMTIGIWLRCYRRPFSAAIAWRDILPSLKHVAAAFARRGIKHRHREARTREGAQHLNISLRHRRVRGAYHRAVFSAFRAICGGTRISSTRRAASPWRGTGMARSK